MIAEIQQEWTKIVNVPTLHLEFHRHKRQRSNYRHLNKGHHFHYRTFQKLLTQSNSEEEEVRKPIEFLCDFIIEDLEQYLNTIVKVNLKCSEWLFMAYLDKKIFSQIMNNNSLDVTPEDVKLTHKNSTISSL